MTDTSSTIILCIEFAIFTLGILHFIFRFDEKIALNLVAVTIENFTSLKQFIDSVSNNKYNLVQSLIFYMLLRYAEKSESFLKAFLISWAFLGFVLVFILHEFHFFLQIAEFVFPAEMLLSNIFNYVVNFFVYFTIAGIPSLVALSWLVVTVACASWPKDH